jgi:hypothetical protein
MAIRATSFSSPRRHRAGSTSMASGAVARTTTSDRVRQHHQHRARCRSQGGRVGRAQMRLVNSTEQKLNGRMVLVWFSSLQSGATPGARCAPPRGPEVNSRHHHPPHHPPPSTAGSGSLVLGAVLLFSLRCTRVALLTTVIKQSHCSTTRNVCQPHTPNHTVGLFSMADFRSCTVLLGITHSDTS